MRSEGKTPNNKDLISTLTRPFELVSHALDKSCGLYKKNCFAWTLPFTPYHKTKFCDYLMVKVSPPVAAELQVQWVQMALFFQFLVQICQHEKPV